MSRSGLPSNRIKLTKERVSEEVCAPGKRQEFLWDTEQRGLGVRITATGSKSFIYQAKFNGQTIRLTIGDAKTMPLSSVWERSGQVKTKELQVGARDMASRLAAMVKEGRDPRKVIQESIEADVAARAASRRKVVTGLRAWNAYIEARQDKWGQRHKDDHIGFAAEGGKVFTKGKQIAKERITQDGILRSLLILPLPEINAEAVQAWVAKNVKKRPARVRLAITLLQTFLRWCAKQKDYQGVNPEACADHKRDLPKQKTRDDILDREQLRLWFKAVDGMPSKTITAYLKIVLLVGARRHELSRMKWTDVDFEWGSMTLRDKAESKGGQDGKRTIAMTPHIRALLLELKTINETPPKKKVQSMRGDAPAKPWKPSIYVFASQRSSSGSIYDPLHAMQNALREVGLPHLTLHGLRRSFATLCEWIGMPEPISSQIQGHKPTTVREKHYKRRPLSLLRLWQTKFEDWVLEEAGVAKQKPVALELVKHG